MLPKPEMLKDAFMPIALNTRAIVESVKLRPLSILDICDRWTPIF